MKLASTLCLSLAACLPAAAEEGEAGVVTAMSPVGAMAGTTAEVDRGDDQAGPSPARPCWPELRQRQERTRPGFVLKNLRIRDNRPKAVLPTGESYVELVELPAFAKAYRLEFRLSFTFKGLMIPSGAVLDEDYCLIEDYPVLQFEQQYGAFLGQWEERAYIPVTEAKARYVLAYVNRQLRDIPVTVSYNGIPGKPMRRFESGYAMVRINK